MPYGAKGSHSENYFSPGDTVRPFNLARDAGMAELVDALDSKSSFRKEVGVRFPLPAPCPQDVDSLMNYCSDCGETVRREDPEGRHSRTQGMSMPAACSLPESAGRCRLRSGERWQDPVVQARDRAALRLLDGAGRFHGAGRINRAGCCRETLEEACAEVEIGHLFAVVDVVDAGQVHIFYTAKLLGDYRRWRREPRSGDVQRRRDTVGRHRVPQRPLCAKEVFRRQGREQRRAHSRAAPREVLIAVPSG